jgi:hypothetical protein
MEEVLWEEQEETSDCSGSRSGNDGERATRKLKLDIEIICSQNKAATIYCQTLFYGNYG